MQQQMHRVWDLWTLLVFHTSPSIEESSVATAAVNGPGRGATRQTSQLPLTRVKNIIKSDPDITLASQEATLVISKVNILKCLLAISRLVVVNCCWQIGHRTLCATFVQAVSCVHCERKEKNYTEKRCYCMSASKRWICIFRGSNWLVAQLI